MQIRRKLKIKNYKIIPSDDVMLMILTEISDVLIEDIVILEVKIGGLFIFVIQVRLLSKVNIVEEQTRDSLEKVFIVDVLRIIYIFKTVILTNDIAQVVCENKVLS